MCGKRLKVFLLSLVLASSLCLSPCFSEVVLTDEEVREMLTEMEASKKDLEELENELETLRLTLNEQRKYYEEQLREARAKKAVPWIITGISCSITAGAIIALTNK